MPDDRGPAVVDTMVFSWSLGGPLTAKGQRYAPHLQGRRLILAAQTVAELHAGALMNGWGEPRRRDLDDRISRVRVAGVDRRLAETYCKLKADCKAHGHGLHQKVHDGDRWIAATAIRYGIPLVSDDAVFEGVPGLDLITERGSG